MRKLATFFVMLLLVGLTTMQPSSAQDTFLTVDTPLNGASLNGGPLVLTGRATPNSVVEVRGDLSGSTDVGSNGIWSLALDPGNFSGRTVSLTVTAWHRWSGRSAPTDLALDLSGSYAYSDNYYATRSVQDSLTDPYYDYPDPNNTNYYVTTPQSVDQALQLSVNSPTNGSSFRGSFVLTGTGTPGSQVVVTGSMNGTTVVDGNGSWEIPLSLNGLAPGTVVNLTAFARDSFGNQSRATVLRYAVSW